MQIALAVAARAASSYTLLVARNSRRADATLHWTDAATTIKLCKLCLQGVARSAALRAVLRCCNLLQRKLHCICLARQPLNCTASCVCRWCGPAATRCYQLRLQVANSCCSANCACSLRAAAKLTASCVAGARIGVGRTQLQQCTALQIAFAGRCAQRSAAQPCRATAAAKLQVAFQVVCLWQQNWTDELVLRCKMRLQVAVAQLLLAVPASCCKSAACTALHAAGGVFAVCAACSAVLLARFLRKSVALLSTNQPTYLPIYHPAYLSTTLPTNQPTTNPLSCLTGHGGQDGGRGRR